MYIYIYTYVQISILHPTDYIHIIKIIVINMIILFIVITIIITIIIIIVALKKSLSFLANMAIIKQGLVNVPSNICWILYPQ